MLVNLISKDQDLKAEILETGVSKLRQMKTKLSAWPDTTRGK